MANYNSFKNDWTGRRVDWDRVYAYQCVDLILQYSYEVLGVQGTVRGNAIDYWTKPSAALLAKCNNLATTDCKQGDIVILRTSGRTDFEGDGHIGICDTQDAGNVWLLEQNALGTSTGTGRDAIGVYRAISKSRIAGVLRPKPAVVVVPVSPRDYMQYMSTAPANAWPVGTVVRTNKIQTNWWNLTNSSSDINNFRPATVLPVHTPFTIGGYGRNTNFPYWYAMSPEDYARASIGDYSNNNGINTTDLENIPLPPRPPAPPVQVKPAETVNFMVDMMCYPSLTDARMKTNVYLEVNIEPDVTYYVHNREDKYLKISDKNMTDRDWWVNMDDNKLPIIIPLPEPPAIEIITKPVEVLLEVPDVKWFWYNEDQQPTVFRYKGFKPATISNLNDHNDTLNLPPNAQGPISRYAMINGNTYLIPDSEFKKGKLYGIYKELMEEVEDRPIRQVLDTNDDGKINVYDLAFIMTPAKDLYTKALPVIVKSQVFIKTNGKQFVDGFSRRRK